MLVAIRVDASTEIGLGHLARCLALGRALRLAGADVVIVYRPMGVAVDELCSQAGLEARALSPPVGAPAADNGTAHGHWARASWQDDATETAALVADRAPEWIVVDHYAWDSRWHDVVREACRCRVAVIDDLADRPIRADLVIDHNDHPDHREKYRGRLAGPGKPTILGGPTYALLGPAYGNGPRWQPRDDVASIGIFMGGTDAGNASAAALTACREAGFEGPVEVVTTTSNPHLSTLKAIVEATPNTALTVGLPDLAGFFARHDLQIGAGGGATWERCCVGVPSVVIETAPNQRAVIPALLARGVIASPSEHESLADVIARLLPDATARRTLSQRARLLVDGRGAQRAALFMCGPTLRVRRARAEDAVMMHAWRNDPATRAVSSDQSVIPLDEHHRWLRRVLEDPSRFLYIGVVGALEIGVIRFDIRLDAAGHEEAEVSLFLDPSLHGLGLGTHLLRAGELEVVRERGETTFRAVVLEGNVASRRMFSRLDYRFDGAFWRKRVSTSSTDERPSPIGEPTSKEPQ